MRKLTSQRQAREIRRLSWWVGLSVLAHGVALLYFGVLSRACAPARPPERTVRYVEMVLETPQEGPVGSSQRHRDESRLRRGVRANPGKVNHPPGARSKEPRRAQPRRSRPHPRKTLPRAQRHKRPPPPRPKQPVQPKPQVKPPKKPQVVAAKPPTPRPEPRRTVGHPTPRTGRSPLRMRGARPHAANPHSVQKWETWRDLDPQLAAQLRYGALPRISHLQPTERALVAAFPADSKPVDHRVVTKQWRMTAYKDGGRLVKNRTNRNVELPPRPGRQPNTPGRVVAMRSGVLLPRGVPKTLRGIANLRIPGRGSGRMACDVYRWDPSPDALREVVLFVDTSGSMALRINEAQICAAGVARSALKRGYRVAVYNFSDFAYFQAPTRDAKKLHRIIALNIGGFTALPRILKKQLPPSKVPRDFVIVSDGLFNKHVQGSVTSHREAFDSHRANRGFFYLFGNPRLKWYRHRDSVYARLRRVGYRTRSLLRIRRNRAVAKTRARR